MTVARLTLWIAILLGSVVAFEAGSAYLHYLETKGLFYNFALRQEKRAAVAGIGVTTKVHPYYGYMQSFTDEGQRQSGKVPNNYGFPQHLYTRQINGCCDFPLAPEIRDKFFVVGIFGNSIAHGLADYFQVVRDLGDLETKLGKPVIVFNLAVGGYHQPQPLLVLTHLLSVGMRFDAVVMFSTVHEVLSAKPNADAGLSLDFPAESMWKQIEAMLTLADNAPARLSATIAIMATELDQATHDCTLALCAVMSRQAAAMLRAVSSRFGSAKGAARLISVTARAGRPELQAVELRQRSTNMMRELTTTHGGLFIHVLAPTTNQHPEAKVAPEVHNRTKAALGLMKSALGPQIVDATQALDELPMDAKLYTDDFGHLGLTGHRQLARVIVDQIVLQHSRPLENSRLH